MLRPAFSGLEGRIFARAAAITAHPMRKLFKSSTLTFHVLFSPCSKLEANVETVLRHDQARRDGMP